MGGNATSTPIKLKRQKFINSSSVVPHQRLPLSSFQLFLQMAAFVFCFLCSVARSACLPSRSGCGGGDSVVRARCVLVRRCVFPAAAGPLSC